MASERAKNAARKVLEKTGAGEPVVMGKILREVGYADDTADNPQQVTATKTYQEEITPFIQKLEKERDRIVSALSKKDLDDVQYQHLTSAVDTLTKNIQLLGGKETQKMGVTINVTSYDPSNHPPQVST
jgi:hypothetical protein